jgi:hypothetical protein
MLRSLNTRCTPVLTFSCLLDALPNLLHLQTCEFEVTHRDEGDGTRQKLRNYAQVRNLFLFTSFRPRQATWKTTLGYRNQDLSCSSAQVLVFSSSWWSLIVSPRASSSRWPSLLRAEWLLAHQTLDWYPRGSIWWAVMSLMTVWL